MMGTNKFRMASMKPLIAAAALGALGLAGGAVLAQQPPAPQTPAAQTKAVGDPKSGAIEVNADVLEAARDEGVAVYTNNVDVLQGTTRLKTDRLTVISNCTKSADGRTTDCTDVQRYIAEGNVYYITPNEKVRGDKAEYNYQSDIITVTGDVILSSGNDGVVHGRKLIYEVTAGKATMTNDGGRVTSIFTPKKTDKPAAPTSPGASPSPNAPR